MDLEKILATIVQIGSDLPAYKSLLDEVLSMFESHDQVALKQAYADAIVASDKAHAAAQAL